MVLCFTMSGFKSVAQEEKDNLMLLSRATPDSVMLRWGPESYRLWLVGNKYGYCVTRTVLMRNGDFIENAKEEHLTIRPLKPVALDKWELLAEHDDYAGVAAQAIYGEDFDLETDSDQSSIIDVVNRATAQESRFGFALFSADQSIKVAEYSGLYFVDKKVKKGEKYLYKVFPAHLPENMNVDTAFYFTGPDEYVTLPTPVNVEAEEGNKMVTISWNRKYQEEFYNSYWVEKSTDNGKTYKRVNDKPLVNTTPEGYDESDFAFLIDTLVNNQKKYLYRVIGISIFGELSPPSKPVEVKGKNIISSVPVVSLSKTEDGTGVVINWEFSNAKNEKIEGFRIFRSDKFAKGYQLLADSIPVIQTSFVDNKALLTGYYRMQAFNSDGAGPYSIPKMEQLVDSIPPASPIELKAVADTTGKVVLRWTENKESDIFGYRVFRANSRHEEFSQITQKAVSQTTFNDNISLKTLSKKVFYKIIAVDHRQNESDFSEILELERPDIVPPSPPVIKNAKTETNGIKIKWIKSSSSDVEQQVLYRNIKGKREWSIVKTFDSNATEYKDTILLNKQTYKYVLLAVDKSGNESGFHQPVTVMFHSNENKNLWIIPKVKKQHKTGKSILTWEAPDFTVVRYMIYGKNNKGVWRLLDGLDVKILKYQTQIPCTEFKIFCKEK